MFLGTSSSSEYLLCLQRISRACDQSNTAVESLIPWESPQEQRWDMDFISLPVEIILFIFSFLGPKHIKEARFLLARRRIRCKRLEEIATHDIFCKTVTTVVYSTCSLRRNYATVDEYYEHLQELPNSDHFQLIRLSHALYNLYRN
jgi:hypothetical protein